jgi:hypothetical protein
VLLDAQATVTDADSPNFNGGQLKVRIRDNGTADDRLAVLPGNGVEVRGDGAILFAGEHVGKVTGGNGVADPLIINFTKDKANPMTVQEVLRRVTFANVAGTAQTTARTLEIIATDPAQAASVAVTKTVNLVAPPVPPQMEVKVNTGLTVTPTKPELFSNTALLVTSPNGNAAGPPPITYTVTDIPKQGLLLFAKASDVPGQPNFLPAPVQVGDTFTQDDIENGRVAYRLLPDSTATADSFSFTAADGVGGTVAKTTVAIRVTRGAAPVQGQPNPAPLPGIRLAILPLAASANVRLDLQPTPVRITLTSALLNFTGTTDHSHLRYEVVAGPQYGTLSLPSTFTQEDVDNNLLTYTVPGAAELPAGVTSDGFSYVVTNTETGGITAAMTFTIALDNPNSPPQFNGPSDGIVLPAIFDEASGSAGALVHDLAQGKETDPDSLKGEPIHYGIAVVGVDTSNGSWQYTTDGGETWLPLAGVSTDTALLLEGDDAETAFRFVRNAGFAGEANLYFRLWDQTTGSSGDLGAVSDLGDSLSTDTGRAVVVIPPVRDPAFTGGPDVVVNEDAGETVMAGWAGNVQDDGLGDPVTFQVSVPPDDPFNDPNRDEVPAGSLAFVEAPTIGADGTLRFKTAPDSFGEAVFEVNALSGTRASTAATLRITVRPVNDAPALTIGQDFQVNASAGRVTLPAWATGITPGPANEADQTLSVTVYTTNNDLFAVPPALDLATGTLTFTPARRASGSAQVIIQLMDNGGTDNGGVDSTTRSFILTVTPSTLPTDPNAIWLSQAYRDLLGRDVDLVGLAAWGGQLLQGASRLQVVEGIQASLEYEQLQAANLFRTYLGREIDPVGQAALVQQFAAGTTLDQAAASVLGSTEYFLAHGGTAAGFLAGVYHDVLHRDIDAMGSTAWGSLLGAGATRDQVALAILGSPEANQDTISAGYQALLGRAVDAVGQSAWGTALQNGLSDEAFLAALIASDEYFNRIR